ncbi:MAG: hypothetical protein Q9157_000692 [Trypethelium eluteriae]
MSVTSPQRQLLSNSAIVTSLVIASRYIVVGLDDGQALVFSPEGASLHVLKASHTIRRLLAVGEDRLAIGCVGGVIESWNLSEGTQDWWRNVHDNTVTALANHGTDKIVSASRDFTIKVSSIKDGSTARTLEGHSDTVIAIATQKNIVVSASYDQTCKSWDIDAGSCLQTFMGHEAKVRSIALEGTTLVSGSLDGKIRVWNVNDGSCKAVIDGHTSIVNFIAIGSGLIVTAGADGKIGAWSLDTAEEKWTIPKAHPHAVNSIKIQNETVVSGGSDDVVRLWKLNDGSGTNELGTKSRAVWDVGFTTEGNVIEAFWEDGKAILAFLGRP